jgi:nucleoside-diphosphate-sugar epimerase
VKIFLTGGTGFIGGAVAERLRGRGDHVKALVRNPAKASRLEEAGCELIHGDLSDEHVMQAAMVGCDAVIHGAAIYKIGILEREHQAMFDANVRGTERVLRSALQTEVPKVVYVSTVNAHGDSDGAIVDESHEHHERYVSYYDETKHKAHKIARALIDEHGVPGVIVEPGLVYGPGDTSELGMTMRMYLKKRLPVKLFPNLGVTACYIDDVAEGVLLALDKGEVGESYILGGEITTSGKLFDTLAVLVGRKPPRFSMPVGMMKASKPIARFINPLIGFPPNMREVIAASTVTYWASCDKAIKQLGYSPRDLEQGLKDMLVAENYL